MNKIGPTINMVKVAKNTWVPDFMVHQYINKYIPEIFCITGIIMGIFDNSLFSMACFGPIIDKYISKKISFLQYSIYFITIFSTVYYLNIISIPKNSYDLVLFFVFSAGQMLFGLLLYKIIINFLWPNLPKQQ